MVGRLELVGLHLNRGALDVVALEDRAQPVEPVLIALDRHVGNVALHPPGQPDVQRGPVHRLVDEHVCRIRGPALSGVRRLGVGERDLLAHVPGRKMSFTSPSTTAVVSVELRVHDQTAVVRASTHQPDLTVDDVVPLGRHRVNHPVRVLAGLDDIPDPGDRAVMELDALLLHPAQRHQ